MANRFQRIILNASSLSPILWVFGIIWLTQNKTYPIPIICFGVGVCFVTLSFVFFFKSKKKISIVNINITDIESQDKWVVAFLVTYCIPLVTLVIKDINFIALSIIVAIILLGLLLTNIVLPNPFLFLLGYHTYSVSSENGVSNYWLLSKRTIRNANQIKWVKRMFEYYLIDEGDTNVY